jgi:hypothetical protein
MAEQFGKLMPAHEPSGGLRFTEEEMRELFEGNHFNLKDVAKLHPEDKKIFDRLLAEKFAGAGSGGLDPVGKFSGSNPIKSLISALGLGGAKAGGVVKNAPGAPGTEAEIAERVLQGGVQNNFKGRVSIKKDPYPPNVNTQSGFADIEDLVLHRPPGQPTPVKFHQNDPDRMRQSIDNLKRTAKKPVKRRDPK